MTIRSEMKGAVYYGKGKQILLLSSLTGAVAALVLKKKRISEFEDFDEDFDDFEFPEETAEDLKKEESETFASWEEETEEATEETAEKAEETEKAVEETEVAVEEETETIE